MVQYWELVMPSRKVIMHIPDACHVQHMHMSVCMYDNIVRSADRLGGIN